jgi:hypothetical protein
MVWGTVNVAFSVPERKWQGFETLPLPYGYTVQVCFGNIRKRKRYGSAIISHGMNEHQDVYG